MQQTLQGPSPTLYRAWQVLGLEGNQIPPLSGNLPSLRKKSLGLSPWPLHLPRISSSHPAPSFILFKFIYSFIYFYVHIHVWGGAYACVCTCDQRSTPVSSSVPLILRHSLFLKLELTALATLAGHQLPENPPVSPPRCQDYRNGAHATTHGF